MSDLPSKDEILHATRDVVRDDVCTALEMEELFTFGEVEFELGLARGVLRRAFRSRRALAEAVRLADVEPILVELSRIARGEAPPRDRLEAWCRRLLKYDASLFFQEQGSVGQAFRQRLQDDLIELHRAGRHAGAFGGFDACGAALFVIDALAGLALSEKAQFRRLDELSVVRDDGTAALLLDNHVASICRAWEPRVGEPSIADRGPKARTQKTVES